MVSIIRNIIRSLISRSIMTFRSTSITSKSAIRKVAHAKGKKQKPSCKGLTNPSPSPSRYCNKWKFLA